METASNSTAASTGRPGVVVLPGEGREYPTLGATTTLLAEHQDTAGTCEVIETRFPPGTGIPPHRHRQTDEATYILEGEIQLQVGERATTAPAGTLAVIPRGTTHAFQNTSDADCRVLIWAMPRFGPGMAEVLEAFAAMPPGAPDPAQLVPLLARFDMELVGPAAS